MEIDKLQKAQAKLNEIAATEEKMFAVMETMAQTIDAQVAEIDRLKDVILTASSILTQEAQLASHKHDFLKTAIAFRMAVLNGGHMPSLPQIEKATAEYVAKGLLILTEGGYILTAKGMKLVKQHMPPVDVDNDKIGE